MSWRLVLAPSPHWHLVLAPSPHWHLVLAPSPHQRIHCPSVCKCCMRRRCASCLVAVFQSLKYYGLTVDQMTLVNEYAERLRSEGSLSP